MSYEHVHGSNGAGHTLVSAASWVLCVAGGIAVLVGTIAWSALCQDGTFERCLNGKPSFELVFQLAIAAMALAASVATRLLSARHAYTLAAAGLAVALLLFVAWALVLDAATHGWDDLKLLWLG